MTIEEIANEFQRTIDAYNLECRRLAGTDTVTGHHPEAERVLELQSRVLVDLKDLRARLVASERATQDAARVATAKAASKDHTMLRVLAGKSAASSARAANKRSIAIEKAAVVNAKRQFKTAVDDAIRQITTSRAALKLEIAAVRKGTKRPPTLQLSEVPPVPPGWNPDPSGRYHHRYWDGGRWTHHVSTNGVASIDDRF